MSLKVKVPNILLNSALLVGLVSLAACGEEIDTTEDTGAPDGEPGPEEPVETGEGNINIASHPTGQAYNGASTGISDVIENYSEVSASVRPYSGPASWMSIFHNEEDVNAGFLSLPDATWAYNGESTFEETDSIRALVQGNDNVLGGYTVPENSGIESLTDLEERNVAADYPGNNIISRIFEAQLNSVDMSFDDLNQVPVSDPVAGHDALRKSRVEATFTGSPEAAGTLELDSAESLKALPFGNYSPSELDNISDEEIDELQSVIPGAGVTAYEGGFVEEETSLITYPTVLIGHIEQLSEEDAYEVLETLWENEEELHPLHSWLEDWDQDSMFDSDMEIPYHPGAVKFYKDIGVWNEEAEENQEELLN